jgi:ubiquinone/menaquinone biosynthesis C-methylase UbiE
MEEFLNPNEILSQVKLRESMSAADFGCGSGGWAIPIAKKLALGRVYAIDILEEPLSALKAKAKLEKVLNIQTIIADIEKGVSLKNESCDFVLMANILFQSEEKEKVLAEGQRVSRPGAEILVVDWKEVSSLGPQQGKISLEKVKEIAGKIGLNIEKEINAGPYHYALILKKP